MVVAQSCAGAVAPGPGLRSFVTVVRQTLPSSRSQTKLPVSFGHCSCSAELMGILERGRQ